MSAKARQLRGRWMNRKSELMTDTSRRLNDLRTSARDRTNELRSTVAERANTLRAKVGDRADIVRIRIDTELRTNTAKWTGIAAGTGVGLGLLARYIRYRLKARRTMPEIVVVSTR